MIAEICRHLDGIPLAIEFAAARAATLNLEPVASGLGNRFTLLTSGRRTALPRHRTLRAVLDWSYELLPEAEQSLLRRLAVFQGGFTLEAATAVTSDDGSPALAVMDRISNLVEKSLVASGGSTPAARWRLLETVRAYALEKLDAGEREPLALGHAEYIAMSLSERNAKGKVDPPPSGRPITAGTSTMCERRSTGPFRPAGMRRSAWR
jgi:predicted ATPase